jgi:glycosyltransferase involved in cell wall biosynthesis
MKVLLISSNSGSRGGGEIYLRYLAEGLSQLGCEVHALIAANPIMDELAASMSEVTTVHRLKLTNTYRRFTRSLGAVVDADQQRQVRRFIDEFAPDVAHINQQVAEDGLDLVLAARASERPFVSTIHITQSAMELCARFAWVRDSVAKRVLEHGCSKLIAVSAVTARRLHMRLPFLKASAVPIVYYGVPDQDHASSLDYRMQARKDWDLADTKIAIGAVGRIEDQKNPLFLVDLLAELAASGREARLVWIGDGALRPALEARAAERAVADRLTIDGWRDDARLRMAGLDVFAMPSRYEGLPLALLEAMHAGLALCVSDADGMPEAVTDGYDGLIRPIASLEAWRDAVAGLADSATERTRLGAAARDTARTRFSIEAMARATLAVYEQAIAENARWQREFVPG